MVKILFFRFLVTNSRLKNKKFHFEVLTSMVALLFSHFRVTNVKLINEKKFLKYYSFNVREPLEVDTTP